MNLKIKRLSKDIEIPAYARVGDAGMDVRAAEDVLIAPGETKVVPTGICVEIPKGYEIQVRPRSGISLKTKLRVANAPGTIDSGYRGEIGVIVDNISRNYLITYWGGYVIQPMHTNVSSHILDINGNHVSPDGASDRASNHGYYQIKKGDRIAQLVFVKHETIGLWEEVEELSETSRGTSAFGSTGV